MMENRDITSDFLNETTNFEHLNINNTTNNNNNLHNLVSTNSFELNTATSLSDDSGLPHTNSSISSGSSRIGLCKYEYEVLKFIK